MTYGHGPAVVDAVVARRVDIHALPGHPKPLLGCLLLQEVVELGLVHQLTLSHDLVAHAAAVHLEADVVLAVAIFGALDDVLLLAGGGVAEADIALEGEAV